MRLRPHHLLCTQGYSGKGYDEHFIQNMTAITTYLRNEENALIDIIFSTDDICAKCPSMLGTDLCKDNTKVKRIDSKVVTYFGIKEKQYLYKDIISKINAQMTKKMMDNICFECAWYPVSSCKKNIGIT